MEQPFMQLIDLPDELLLMVFKNPTFTNHLTLMRCSSNDDIYPMRKKTINRFCLQILPQIHHKIQWLNIEALSMKRILLSNEYPNLYGLGLYN
ncbi:unnamed protein product, partial [Rotaria sordida]